MSSADRQVIEMANRPRARLERMERMAKRARWRMAWRADLRRLEKIRKDRIRERVACAASAALLAVMILVAIVAC